MARRNSLCNMLGMVLVCLIVGSILVVFPLIANTRTVFAQEPGSISGRVFDESNNNAIEGAYVVAWCEATGDYGEATTESDGTYTIPGLEPGNYFVVAGAQDYAIEYYDNQPDESSANPVEVASGADHVDVDFSLAAESGGGTGSISGRVFDESNNNAIEGAYVVAWCEATGGYGEATTESDGTYTIPGLEPGNYFVGAGAQDYAIEYYDNQPDESSATAVDLAIGENKVDVNFSLAPESGGATGSISGTVLGESNNPILGATVRAQGVTDPGVRSAVTGAGGSYTIADLASDNYTVWAEAPGYATEYYDGADGVPDRPSATPVELASGEDRGDIDFSLALQSGGGDGSISGVVQDESATPIPGATVYAQGETDPDVRSAVTGAGGSYTIADLASDNYTVWAEAPGYATEYYDGADGVPDRPSATPVELASGEDRGNINFDLAAGSGGDTTPPTTPVVTDDGATTMSTTQLHATWTACTDADSGVVRYEYAIGTTQGGTNVRAWTSASLETQATATGLTLTVNQTYYFSVRAINGAGLPSSPVGMSDGITVTQGGTPPPTTSDTTPPSTPGVTDDGDTTASTTQLHATWTASTDAESGIARYEYAIGTTSGGTETLGWTQVGTNTQVTKDGLSLAAGQTYYISVKAFNGAGLLSTVGVSNGIKVIADTTPPSTPAVTDEGTTTASTTQLHASWTASTDAESSVVEYQYAIGTTSGGTEILSWTSAGTNTQVTATGLTLKAGKKYYISVKAKNGGGSWSEAGVSDGIKVEGSGGGGGTPVWVWVVVGVAVAAVGAGATGAYLIMKGRAAKP